MADTDIISTEVIQDSLKGLKSFDCSKCVNIQMSEDNIIVLNVGKGIHIVGLDSSCVNHQLLKRQYLPGSYKVPLKSLLSSNDNKLIWQFDYDSLKEAFCTVESFEFISKCPCKPCVTLARMSPPHLGDRYLAAVTSSGALEIYQFINLEWVEVFDVATYWLHAVVEELVPPRNWQQWKNVLNLAKPETFCWLKTLSSLLLIVTFKSGEIVIFSHSSEESFSLTATKRFSCGLKAPTEIIGFENSGNICIVIGFECGKIAAFFVNNDDNESVPSASFIWDYEDFLMPKHMVSVSVDSHSYLVVSKTNFLLIYDFDSSGDVNTVEKKFDEVIKNVTVSDKFVYVAFDEGKFVHITLPSGENRCVFKSPDESNRALEGFAISHSGLLWVIVTSVAWSRCRVSLVTLVNENPPAALGYHLRAGSTLNDYLDLLWLIKFSMLENTSDTTSVNPTANTFTKLFYWKLQLKLAGEGDDKLEICLRNVEQELVEEYSEKMAALGVDVDHFLSLTASEELQYCPICSTQYVYRDVRIVKCANSHVWPRCCITFKPCITTCYAVCSLCDAVALLETESGFPSYKDHICPFCDGSFRMCHALN